jgi:hypothetical protein
MFFLGYRNLIDRTPVAGTRYSLATPGVSWQAASPLSNVAVRARSARARTLVATSSIRFEFSQTAPLAIDLVSLIGIMGVPNVPQITVQVRLSRVSLGAQDAGRFDSTFFDTQSLVAGLVPTSVVGIDAQVLARDFWIDCGDSTCYFVTVDLFAFDKFLNPLAVDWDLHRLWIGPAVRLPVDMAWTDNYTDTAQVSDTENGAAYPSLSDNEAGDIRIKRSRDVTIGSVPFADLYKTRTLNFPPTALLHFEVTVPSLQEVLMHIGATRNCVSLIRDVSDHFDPNDPVTAPHEFARYAQRLAIYGRQSINPLSISHEGGDHYSVNLAFIEEL